MKWRGLLVSVRSAEEARAALAGGADIIDVKEPSHGPLGPAEPAVVAEVAAIVAARAPWTMAGGELIDVEHGAALSFGPGQLADLFAAIAGSATLPAAVKFGLAGTAGTRWEARLGRLFGRLPSGPARVPVAYADWRRAHADEPGRVIAAAARLGCGTVLIDTYDKSSAGLFSRASAHEAATWVAAAHAAGLQVVLAGRIGLDDIALAAALAPDAVGMRSAVCSGGREGTVQADLVRQAASVLASVTATLSGESS